MTISIAYKKMKRINGTGSKIAYRFIELFQNEFCNKLVKYAKHTKAENDLDHIFYYGEQPTKTYVTAVLDKICDTYFMQEYFVQRKEKLKRKRAATHNGRVDYWFRYGSNTKFSGLLEFKQDWIRYYSPTKWTIYRSIIRNHKSGVNQINLIKDKRQFTSDNLYAFALTLIPIFVQYKKSTKKPTFIDSSKLKYIAKDVCKETEAHGFGAYLIPKSLCPIQTFETYQGDKHRSYPAIIFLWSVKRVHRG